MARAKLCTALYQVATARRNGLFKNVYITSNHLKRHHKVERFQKIYTREIYELKLYFNDKQSQTSLIELSNLNQKLLEKLNQVIDDI